MTTTKGIKINMSMTVMQARNVAWPFRPYRGQLMGTLVDNKQLSLKDLGFAVETAWNKQVREAASTLILHRLEQVTLEPEATPDHLNIVSSGRSFSQRRQFALTLIQGSILGFALGVSVCLFLSSLLSRTSETQNSTSRLMQETLGSPQLLLGVVIIFAVIIAVFVGSFRVLDKLLDLIDKRIANYQRGEEGEDRTVEMLRRLLDSRWHLFRNVVLPGRGGDLDGVLVGPSGVWLLEIKSYSRDFRNIGSTWEYRAGNQWKLSRSSPSQQAKNNAARLAQFFSADGIQQWTHPVVVWANPEASVNVENPMVAVWTLDQLPDILSNLPVSNPMSESNRQKIVDKLTKLCERELKHRKEAQK